MGLIFLFCSFRLLLMLKSLWLMFFGDRLHPRKSKQGKERCTQTQAHTHTHNSSSFETECVHFVWQFSLAKDKSPVLSHARIGGLSACTPSKPFYYLGRVTRQEGERRRCGEPLIVYRPVGEFNHSHTHSFCHRRRLQNTTASTQASISAPQPGN